MPMQVKDKEGARKKLQKCVFCEKGTTRCESCEGTGKDIALGSGDCFLCEGKGKRQCEICLGMGMVDKVRRGGTDTKGLWVGSDKVTRQQAMAHSLISLGPPSAPFLAPFDTRMPRAAHVRSSDDLIRRPETPDAFHSSLSQVMDPLSPQYEPYILTLDGAEKYVWCQCGVSVKQPFCDGASHRAYGIKPVPFTAEGEKGAKVEAQLCGCKYSNTKPYCDGSHVALKAQDDENKRKAGTGK